MLLVQRVCFGKYFVTAASLIRGQRSFTKAVMNGASAEMKFSTAIKNHENGSNGHNYTVCVEGNIGSGKTTLLNHFLEIPNVQVIQEPVNMWRNVRGHNALGKMYEDPQRWAMALQTYVQLTMLDIHTKPQTEPVRMMERSIHSARQCFVENLHQSGNLPDIEYVMLDEWYKWITATQDVHVDLFVYLYTTPETCHERIKRRCRPEEKTIPLDLLQQLHEHHEDWLKHKKYPCNAPVLTIDANGELSNMFEQYKEQEDLIMGRRKAAL